MIIKCGKCQTLPHISFKIRNFHVKAKVVVLLVFSTNLKVHFRQCHDNYISFNKLKMRTMPECPLSILMLFQISCAQLTSPTFEEILKLTYVNISIREQDQSLKKKLHYETCGPCLR